jgi:hypothetical protein
MKTAISALSIIGLVIALILAQFAPSFAIVSYHDEYRDVHNLIIRLHGDEIGGIDFFTYPQLYCYEKQETKLTPCPAMANHELFSVYVGSRG